jgi:hypothetical protein
MPVPAAIPPEPFSCTRSQQADTELPDPQFLARLHTNLYKDRQGDTCWNRFLESSDPRGDRRKPHKIPMSSEEAV